MHKKWAISLTEPTYVDFYGYILLFNCKWYEDILFIAWIRKFQNQ